MSRTPLICACLFLFGPCIFADPGDPVPQVEHLKLEPEQRIATPVVDPASDAAEKAIRRFKIPSSLEVKLWASEPMLANPVAISFDEKGRLFVSETHRYRTSVLDIRSYMGMLEQDLASRSIEDRSAMIHRVFGEEAAKELSIESEVVRLVEDTKGTGVADRSGIFATGFNSELDGIAAGVLARQGKVWFTNIPSLWLLEQDATGRTAGKRTELLRGFGVHFNYTGHDFHGLIFGPDGKLYFTIGDRGTHVTSKEGKLVDLPDMGACFRCNPDGTDFEVVASGLRNPQELAFDEYGNLFTGDNDCDNGDLERLVYIVEGGDSGWRIGYQHAPMGKAGPWMRDDLWKPRFPGQPAYLLPAICNIEDGPSGVAYYPGTGLTPEFKNTFFICHFKGSISRSGVQSYKIKEAGATFQIVDSAVFIEGILPTDVTFGPDGRLYVADWVEGWPKSRKGRIYAISPKNEDPAQTRQLAEMKNLLATGMHKLDTATLLGLLKHPDMRIRQEAQFELASRGASSVGPFESVANDTSAATVTRLHALWGLGQLAVGNSAAMKVFPALLADKDAEVRAQAAKLLGDHTVAAAYDSLIARLDDPAPRVQFFAAQSLGKLQRPEAATALIALLRKNADADAYIRHAAVFALSRLGNTSALADAAKDSSASVRLGALLVYRRLGDPAIAEFLKDSSPYLVREAALAINDAPIVGANSALAARLDTVNVNDEPLVLRAINARFRDGKSEDAQALAQFATRSDVPEAWRVESLFQLAHWVRPPARDRLVGLYRPLPPRDPAVVVAALQPVLPVLLHQSSEKVVVETVSTIAALHLDSAGEELYKVVADEKAAPRSRAAALSVLDELDNSHLDAALKAAGNANVAAPRLEAMQILAHRSPNSVLPIVKRLISEGDEAEQQAAFIALGKLKTPEAAQQIILALDRLEAGKVAGSSQVELLDVAEKNSDKEVQARFKKLRAAWAASNDPLAPYRSALAGGNPRAGARTFFDNPVMACVRCHRAGPDGGDAGPDLSEIGSHKSPEYLLESVIKPNARIAAGFDVITATFKNGSFETGTVVRETDDELVLRRPDNTELVVKKTEIAQRQAAPSSMPEIFAQILSRSELRDVIAFLRNLHGRPSPAKHPARALAALEPQKNVSASRIDAPDTPDDNGEAPAAAH